MSKDNRTYRDTVFRKYFSELQNFIELAEAVSGEKIPPDLVKPNTLEDVFFSNLRNDVSFSVGIQYFIFFEHQSTLNYNMALRMLLYIGILYRTIIPSDFIYRTAAIRLPAPRFFVFYNGKTDIPERSQMKLSDLFLPSSTSDIEVTVTVYNINYKPQYALLKKCRAIHDYSYFINEITTNIAGGMTKEEAIEKAMTDCIEKNIMRDFLEKHSWEVFDMISLRWNEEDAKNSYIAQGIEQGMEKGASQGRNDALVGVAKNLLSMGTMPIDAIAQVVGWTPEKIEALRQ